MPEAPAPPSAAEILARLMQDPERLRRRFILSQVLGPPKSKRPRPR